MKIGELAHRTGVSTDTLRYYEKVGLIRSDRRGNGYRDFDPGMVRLVGLLRRGKDLGFSLREMQKIVEMLSSREVSAAETAALLQAKIAELDAKIAAITEMKAALSEALETVCPLRR